MSKFGDRYTQMRIALTQWVSLTDARWHQLAAIFQLKQLSDRY